MQLHDSVKLFFGFAAMAFASQTGTVWADLIPPGHKPVSHKLVMADSPLLEQHRLIATPVRGFGGFEEIKAARPFSFSGKYGTRLYVVPSDFVPPDRVSPGKRLPYPSCDVPVSCVTYMPRFSPVESLRSTLRLVEVGEDGIRVELIDHVELDAQGRPASMLRHMLPLCAIAAAGLAGCVLLWRRTRRSADGESALPAGTE